MKKTILFGTILTVFLLIGCVQQTAPQKETCKSPYIEYKLGECCLDSNGNNICDNDEKQEEVVVEEVAEETTKITAPVEFISTKCTLPPGIECVDHKITSNGVIVTLQNGYGHGMSGVVVTVTDCGSSSSPSLLPNGEIGTYYISCTPVGTEFNKELKVTYTSSDTGLTHRTVGWISAVKR